MTSQAMNEPDHTAREARQEADGAQPWREYQRQQRSISDKIERLRQLRLAQQSQS